MVNFIQAQEAKTSIIGQNIVLVQENSLPPLSSSAELATFEKYSYYFPSIRHDDLLARIVESRLIVGKAGQNSGISPDWVGGPQCSKQQNNVQIRGQNLRRVRLRLGFLSSSRRVVCGKVGNVTTVA